MVVNRADLAKQFERSVAINPGQGNGELFVVARQPLLTEPGEMPPDVRDAFESKRFDRFASNMRDGFLDGIGGVDQA